MRRQKKSYAGKIFRKKPKPIKLILKWAKKCARPLRNWEVPCLKTFSLLKRI